MTGDTALSSRNEEMVQCLELALIASGSSAPVMITGENGVGKTLLANAIHNSSSRRTHPCLTLNCATVNDKDLKKRLYGNGKEETGDGDDEGLIHRVGGGTLIIDSLHVLPTFVQKELLTLLKGDEPGAPRKNSRNDELPAGLDARLISTSGVELSRRIAGGPFMEELLYCLGEITIRIPPLRQRREDIAELAATALAAANRLYSKNVGGLSRTAYDFIRHYDFPGNVRELFLIINRAVRDTSRDTVYVEDLGLVVDAIKEDPHLFSDMTLLSLAEMEKRHINKTLLRTGWKKRAAARILHITETMLNRKIRIYKLEQGSRVE